ncbi:MAG: hypothetical protein OXF60_06775 [Gammaproteobacteria bacterium]|nr:hypothetical protein [Gammaproteobacteria bacterium]MCY4219739.1 hypothetical protein [Gammaproteobacteria bacterium]
MSDYTESERHDLNRAVKQIIRIQSVASVTVLIAFILYYKFGGSGDVMTAMIAVVYGSMLALIGTMISARSARRSSDFAATGSNAAMVPIFSGLVLKLIVMGGGIGLGLVFLNLDSVPMLVSFAVVKISSVFSILA